VRETSSRISDGPRLETGRPSILDLIGRITIGEEAASLRDTIKQHLDSGQKNILRNLAEVSYIDSTGWASSWAALPRWPAQAAEPEEAAGIDADH
jgi:hypothetical protein